ncbi:hypothetical protein ACK11Z_02610 [Methanoculleus bourgensis]|uniref:hypothetical protein n=1 Tax=Methanoculleus bourgensis TaxID=83986 RepID=UPI003B93D073
MTTLSFTGEWERMTWDGIVDVVDMKQMAFRVVVMLAAMVPAALASDGHMTHFGAPSL